MAQVSPRRDLPKPERWRFHCPSQEAGNGGIVVKMEEEHVTCPKWYPVFLSGLGLTSLIFYQLFT